jgi:ATP-dependent DNA helicase RecG
MTEGDVFRIVVKTPEETSVETPMKTGVKASGKTSGKTSGKILDLIRENTSISIPEMASKLERTPRTIEMQINQLKSEGLLRRVGAAKGGHWEVLD